MEKKSIISGRVPVVYTPANPGDPAVGWRSEDFNELIYSQGYDAYIDRALRCPCVDRTSGQPLSTCRNCLGRGWFFVDRKETRVVSQGMNNKKQFQNWSEVNRGIARITARGVDKMGFMDRIILMDLTAYYSEILRPMMFENQLIAYPIYEPMQISDIFLFVGDATKLEPIPSELYQIDGNKMIFDTSLNEFAPVESINDIYPKLSISIRYSYRPVYHVLEANRELMRVRERTCSFTDEELRDMPLNLLCRKAHYIFAAQKFGESMFDNTEYPTPEE